MINLYLSGNMTPSLEYYKTWTSKMKYDFQDTVFKCSIADSKTGAKFIVNHDLARLKRCDALVVNLSVTSTEHHLTGLIVEVYEAFKQNMPVYAFYDDSRQRSTQALSPWLQQFITNSFNSYDDLMDYLLFEENLPN